MTNFLASSGVFMNNRSGKESISVSNRDDTSNSSTISWSDAYVSTVVADKKSFEMMRDIRVEVERSIKEEILKEINR